MTNQCLNIDKLNTTENDRDKTHAQREISACKLDTLNTDKSNAKINKNIAEYDNHPVWNDGSSIFQHLKNCRSITDNSGKNVGQYNISTDKKI